MKTNELIRSRQAEALLSMVFCLALFFYFPTKAMVAASALYLALQVYLFPDRFRQRNGSLTMAIGLVAFLALSAVAVFALSMIPRHG